MTDPSYLNPTDACPTCGGAGCEDNCGFCLMAYAGPDSHKICRSCQGSGMSTTTRLGHPLR